MSTDTHALLSPFISLSFSTLCLRALTLVLPDERTGRERIARRAAAGVKKDQRAKQNAIEFHQTHNSHRNHTTQVYLALPTSWLDGGASSSFYGVLQDDGFADSAMARMISYKGE